MISSDCANECFTYMIRIPLEVKLTFPTDLSAKTINPTAAGECFFLIFENDEGNRKEPARSPIELEPRIPRLIDEHEHSASSYAEKCTFVHPIKRAMRRL